MNDREAFLHNYDQLLQQLGQGATAGKILGTLMIGKFEEMTLDQLSEEIGRSKSTIHASIRNLVQLGLIEERIADSTPSEGRYPHLYSFRKNFFEFSLQQYQRIAIFKKLIADSILFLISDGIEDGRIEAFEKTYALYGFYEEKLRANLKKWKDIEESGEYRRYLDFYDN